MGEFLQKLLRNIKVLIMTEDEKRVQQALGLIEKYEGYIQEKGSKVYAVYTVDALSYDNANKQLRVICRQLYTKTRKKHFVKFIVRAKEPLEAIPI